MHDELNVDLFRVGEASSPLDDAREIGENREMFYLLNTDTQTLFLLWLFVFYRQRDNNRSKIAILSEQQNHRCCYCGVRFLDPPDYGSCSSYKRWKDRNDGHPDMATIEHVIRLVDGGVKVWENEVAACARCNHSRHDIDAYSFYTDRLAIIKNRKKRRHKKRRQETEKRGYYYRDGKRVYLALWPKVVRPEGLAPPNVGV